MRHPALDRMLCGRQSLPQHLAAKHLRAANVATGPAKDVFLDTLKLKQRNQVIKNSVHQLARRPPSTAMPVPRFS